MTVHRNRFLVNKTNRCDHTIVQFIVAKQTKDTHLHKNTKEKLYRTMAAIWYNKNYIKADVQLRTPDDGHKGCPKHVE
jgi:ribosomal protein L18